MTCARALPVLTLGLSLLLAGCKSTSPEPRDLGDALPDVPDSWAATKEGQAGVDGQWIDRFNDARLEALVAEALEHNHDLRLAANQLQIAWEDARLAGVALRPTTNLSFNPSRQQQNFAGSPFGTIFSGGDPNADADSQAAQADSGSPAVFVTDSYGISLDTTWELDLWGRVRSGQGAVIALGEASALDYQATRISLAAQTAKAYFALAEAEAQADLAVENRKIAERTEELIRARYESGDEAGGGVLAQLRLAQSDTASAGGTVAQRSELRDQIARQLERVLGRHPSGKIRAGRALARPPSRPPSGLPSDLLLRRPDILAAERRWAAQGSRLKEAALARFPRLALTGSIGTSTDELANVLNPNFTVWTLAGSLIQPVLTGGQLKIEKKKRELQDEQAMISLQRTVVNAFGEVENALASESWLATRGQALTEASEFARDAVREAQSSYSSGTGDVLTLLTAQARLNATEAQRLALQRLRLDNRIDLHLALGGDFKVRPRPAAKASSPSDSPDQP